MPDKNGRIPPVAFSVQDRIWQRVFGPLTTDPDDVELDDEEPEFEIEWTPDWSLDGAHFTPE